MESTKAQVRKQYVQEKYHAKVIGDGKYRVERKSGLCSAWFTLNWKFENLEDAIAYCDGEVKKDALRVIECSMDTANNTLYTKTLYTKEA